MIRMREIVVKNNTVSKRIAQRSDNMGCDRRLTSGNVKITTINVNPLNINISQNAHLHPFAITANPATIGAIAGAEPADKPYKPIA